MRLGVGLRVAVAVGRTVVGDGDEATGSTGDAGLGRSTTVAISAVGEAGAGDAVGVGMGAGPPQAASSRAQTISRKAPILRIP
jgi:hypothetical protein